MSRAAFSAVLVLAGCTDVPLAYELDHTRIMAVRISPPALRANEQARLDVLVTDAVGGPRVAPPDTIEVSSALVGGAARDEDGWQLTAPDQATLDTLRAQAGLAGDAALITTLQLVVHIGEEALAATKTVQLDATADNPGAATITHDGTTGPMTLGADRDVELSPEPMLEGLSYRWFSAVGDLKGYTRGIATLDPDASSSGPIVLVVRDQAGGTAWSIEQASVAP